MIYVTGDTHGDQVFWDVCLTGFLKAKDTIIVAGDFGVGFFGGRYWSEEQFMDYLAEQEYTVLFCDGNHENFDKLNSYEISEWHNGYVHFIRDNVIHLMRGEIYEIEGKKMFVMGGGYSIDKSVRVPGESWWAQEMPNEAEYKNAFENLRKYDHKVDYIVTHTAPKNTVEYLSRMGKGIRNTVVEEFPLTGFLQWIADATSYERWYVGHFHIDSQLWKGQYALYREVRELHSGEVVKRNE